MEPMGKHVTGAGCQLWPLIKARWERQRLLQVMEHLCTKGHQFL